MHVNPETTAILSDLNEPQRQAVTHRDGPLLVLAGPGSGKTRVITRRAAYLVHTGVPARNILAITFTNKAADEMKRRIEALGVRTACGCTPSTPWACGCCASSGHSWASQPGFSIYDEADRLSVVKEAMQACGTSEVLLRPEAVQAAISNAKNKLQSPAQYADRGRHVRATRRRPRLRRLRATAAAAQRRRFRRPADARGARCCATSPDIAERLNDPLPLRADRRVPGHQPRPVPDRPRHRRTAPRQHLRHRRPRPEHLRLARGRHPQHPGVRAATTPTPTSSGWSRTTARRRTILPGRLGS